MKTLLALLRREILEHRSIWLIPLILIGVALLVRLSLVFGNLEFNFEVPDQLNLDGHINSVRDGVTAQGLNIMNFIVMKTLMAMACIYSLWCLFTERQDQSVLFWRSLPISDFLTVTSKVLIALVVIPLTILVCQTLIALLFLGGDAFSYLSVFFSNSLTSLFKVMLWSLIPTIGWCMFCSEVSSKNPFLLALIAPILVWIVDGLFLDGTIVNILQPNRWVGFKEYTSMSLISGLMISAVGLALAIIKRSQRI